MTTDKLLADSIIDCALEIETLLGLSAAHSFIFKAIIHHKLKNWECITIAGKFTRRLKEKNNVI